MANDEMLKATLGRDTDDAVNRTMPLIGFAGPAHSGKDTACDYLCGRLPFLRKYTFATPIKRATTAMFGLSRRHVDGDLKEIDLDWLGVSPRQLMQTLGTERGRNMVRDDVWLKVLEHSVLGDVTLADEFAEKWAGVVSDVRFANEAAWVRGQGGVVVHILRSGLEGVAPHCSEGCVAVREGDVLIENNGTPHEFESRLDDLVFDLGGRYSVFSELPASSVI